MRYVMKSRYEEFTLLINVSTKKSERIHLIVGDNDQPNTLFTKRWKTIDNDFTFFVRLPITGRELFIDIYNEKYPNVEADSSFTVTKIEKLPLEKRIDVIDMGNDDLRGFVNFATRFCYHAGNLNCGNYRSRSGKFCIEYLPTIISSRTNRELETPARINKDTGIIQISKKKFFPDTVPMRMAILLHEFSHFYVNDDIDNETEADLNALLIYLGLGYPRFEAHEAFLKTFINTPTPENKKRYDVLKNFIDDFEKNNYLLY